MKKLFASILVVALILAIGATCAFAVGKQNRGGFANAGSGDCLNGSVCSQDGTGRRNGCGNAAAGVCFVDENGDGICDDCPNDGACPQDGTGAQCGRQVGRNK